MYIVLEVSVINDGTGSVHELDTYLGEPVIRFGRIGSPYILVGTEHEKVPLFG